MSQHDRVARRVVALLALGLVGGISPRHVSAQAAEAPTSSHGTQADVLVWGGAVVQGGRSVRLDLLLRPQGKLFTLVGTSVGGVLSAPDTLDVSGLFIHSTHRWEPEVNTTPSLRNFAMYVVRTGAGPATPAVWLIDEGVRKIDPAANHPPGPVDERVGCYALDRGAWSNDSFVWDPPRQGVWFPNQLQLHWQYQWSYGGDPYLVATDMTGAVRSREISWYRWRSIAPDSLEVTFGMSYVGTTFRGVAKGRDYLGELSVRWDVGEPVRATAYLHRVDCADEDGR